MARLTKRLILLALAFVCCGSFLLAQETSATIMGTVRDPSGAVIPKANVILTNVNTGVKRTTMTNADGIYVFTPLPIGTYKVAVHAQGFKGLVRNDLEVNIQQTLEVNVKLELGTTTQSVQVTGAPPALQTNTSSVGQVVNTAQAVNLPLNGRDIYDLVTLSPGASTSPDGRVSISGQPSQQQDYLLDGVDNNNYQGSFNSGGAYNLAPAPDAIQEFKVQTNNFSAQFGRAAGGIVNVVTKSGTNKFHGDVYEFFRNEKLDARNFFASSRPPYNQNQFGASIGGPIVHNKLFFFGDYEGFRSRRGTTQFVTLPSAPWRNGNFSNLLTGTTFVDSCTGNSYDTGQLFDPTTTHAVTCTNGSTGYERNPIVGNIVNPSSIVDAAKNTIALLPVPNVGSSQYTSSPVLRNDFDQFDIKMNYQFSNSDQFSWRYAFRQSPPGGVANIPGPAGSGTINNSRQQGVEFGWTHIFNPRTVGEFRYGYTRNANNNAIFGTNLNPATLGYGGLPFQSGVLGGLPQLSFSDVTGIGAPGWSPTLTTARDNDYSYTLSMIRGKHTFKFGGDFNKFWFTQFESPAPTGQYSFSGIFTSDLNAPGGASVGSGFAQFLFGMPDFSSFSNSIDSDNGAWRSALYAEDNYRITQKLTLNLGFRWAFGNTEHERFDRVTSINFKTGEFLIPITRKGIPPEFPSGVPVQYSNDTSLLLSSNKNFMPRLGFAYHVLPKTVVRSAFGIFYGYAYNAGTLAMPLDPPWANIAYIQPANTGPYDLATGQPNQPVTNITTGFPSNLLQTDFSQSLLFLYATTPQKFNWPYTLGWNFTVEQDLGRNTVLTVGYDGTKGTHLITGVDANQPRPSADASSNPATRRPYPNFGSFGYAFPGGNSDFNALEASLQKRFSNGLTYLVSYTWSHSIDTSPLCVLLGNTGAGGDCFRNFYDRQIDRGNSSFDVRNHLASDFIYNLPVGRGEAFGRNWSGLKNQALGDWRLTGLLQFQSGYHFTPVTSADPANSPTYQGVARPNLVANPLDFSYGQSQQAAMGCPVGHQSKECFFNPAAFTLANPGQFGNAGRNILVGPGLADVDFGLFKEFPFGEDRRVQFRAEFFNLFNHPNFGLPDNLLESSTFSRPLTASAGRDIQFAMKIMF